MEHTKETSSSSSGPKEVPVRREESPQGKPHSGVLKSSVSFSGEDGSGKLSDPSSVAKKMSMMSFGESAAGSADYSSLGTSDFLQKRATTTMFGVPPGFFESRPSIRVWGMDELADPMVQPYDKRDPSKEIKVPQKRCDSSSGRAS